MEKKSKQDLHTWDMMFFVREKLGVTELQKIFSRGRTQIDRYCLSPDHGDYERNPLDRLCLMFEKLMRAGGREMVMSMINYMAAPLGCRLTPLVRPKPDKPSVEEECLDDFPELVELDRLIALDSPPAKVARQVELAKEEIDETFTRYEEYWIAKYGRGKG